MGRIVDRYVLRELVVPFAMGVGVFTFFLVIDRIYQLTGWSSPRASPSSWW